MSKPIISIVAAIGKNRELGANGQLPWHIPEDLAHFKKATMGHPVVMGRKTYESIGKPLPGRENIIITRNADYKVDGCIVATSVEEAIAKAKEFDQEEICIIGGGQIFEQAMGMVDLLRLTIVDSAFKADTYFPKYQEFSRIVSEKTLETDKYKLKFIDLERG